MHTKSESQVHEGISDGFVNLAIEIRSIHPKTDYSVEYSGRVIAPFPMAGKVVQVTLSHHGLWNYLNATDANEASTQLADLGYLTKDELFEAAENSFATMNAVGSVAIFQSCLQRDDGSFTTWVGSVIGNEVEAHSWTDVDVIDGYVRIVQKYVGQKRSLSLDVLEHWRAKKIETGDDFLAFFKDNMQAKVDGKENNSNCLFRVFDKQSKKQVFGFWVYSSRRSISFVNDAGVQQKFMIPGPFEKTWREAVIEGQQSEGAANMLAVALGLPVEPISAQSKQFAHELRQLLQSGRMFIDAIPGRRLRFLNNAARNNEELSRRFKKIVQLSSPNGRDNFFDKPQSAAGLFYPMFAIAITTTPKSVLAIKDQPLAVIANNVIWEDFKVAVPSSEIPAHYGVSND